MTPRGPLATALHTFAFVTSLAGFALAPACSSSSGGTTVPDAASETGPRDAGKDAARDGGGKDAAHDASSKDARQDATPREDAVAFDAPSVDGWSVPTGCNPLAITAECMLPYPSDLMTVADTTSVTGRRIALPPNALDIPAGVKAIDMTPFNRFDGAPTSEPILVHFGVEVDASYLADDTQTASSVLATSAIALFNETTGERVPFLSEMDANDPTNHARHALIIRPLTPLDFDTKYVVALTGALRDTSHKPLPPSIGFLALRDKVTTKNATLEGARAHFEEIFTFLEAHGYPRADLALAWDYTTVSNPMVIGPITAMRQEVFHATTARGPEPADAGTDGGGFDAGPLPDASPPDGGAGQITYAITSVTPSPYQPGAKIVEGVFTPPNYLRADNTILYTKDGSPTLQTGIPAPSYPFTMIVPPVASTKSLSLVLFGHGLFGNGRSYLTSDYGSTLQPLTQSLGSVIVATNWIGLSDGDLQLIINDVAPDINRVGLVTDRLLQAIVNNLSLIELTLGALGDDPNVRMATTHPLIDPTKIHYYGVSLGGIEGSSLVSVSRNVTRAVVAVPGASWSNLLARSVDYAQIQAVINITYPDILLQQEFIGMLQARFDPADPVNLATLFQRSPLPDSPSKRTAILQESIDDCQVPNLTTEILARAYGARQLTPDLVPIYGLTTDTSPTSVTSISQFDILSDTAKYKPPTTNVLPTMDNGAHFDLAFQGAALEEVVSLFTQGEAKQICGDGGVEPCNLP